MNPFPFPHAVLDGMWKQDLLCDVIAEFPRPGDMRWRRFDNEHEQKLGCDDRRLWGPKTRLLMDEMMSTSWAEYVGSLFDIEGLVAGAEGGGMHRIEPGGHLDVHADFNHSEDGMWRRVNCLLFLNPDWCEADGGRLELWDDDGVKVSIAPKFDRTVVFVTSDRSFHGHPHPLPGPKSRLSLACYFFTIDRPDDASDPHSTVFR